MKKYDFTGETLKWYGRTLSRIRALKDFGDVKAGDLGGWIEKEENLSHEGDCWVYDEAKVSEDAHVIENAKAYDRSEISGQALMREDAVTRNDVKIYDGADIYGQAEVCGQAEIYEKAKICKNSKIYNSAKIHGNAWICGNSKVYEFAEVYENSEVYGNSEIRGNSKIHGNTKIYNFAKVCDNAEIKGDTEVLNDVIIGKDAVIESSRDYIFIGPLGSKNKVVTVFKTYEGVRVLRGCFYGSIEEFESKVKETHKDNEYGNEYLDFVELLKTRFNKKSPQNGRNRLYRGGNE